MDFDKPPDLMTLILLGLAGFLVLGCCCAATVPLIIVGEQRGLLKHR